MWKNLLSIVVAAGIIAGGMILFRHRHQLFRPNFDRTGGTLLVFEVDGKPPDEGLDELVLALTSRFDATGGTGIVVRADGERHIEVGVPSGKQHDEQVDLVKRLVGRIGILQFRILANRVDDAEATAVALAAGKGAKLDVAPPPVLRDGKGGDEFKVLISGEPAHRYRWVAMSEALVKTYRLDSAALIRENPVDMAQVEEACRTGAPFSPSTMANTLLLARKLAGASDPTFFVLVREHRSVEDVSAGALENVRVSSRRGRALVQFRFSREAGESLFELTRKNVSPPHELGSRLQRHLGILLDGEVLAVPVLTSAMGREMQLSGDFSKEDAEDLAHLLRGGALPCRLKPKPVSERSVGKPR